MDTVVYVTSILMWILCPALIGLILLQGAAGDISSAFGGGGQLDASLGVGAHRKMAQATGVLAVLFFVMVLIMAYPHRGSFKDLKNAPTAPAVQPVPPAAQPAPAPAPAKPEAQAVPAPQPEAAKPIEPPAAPQPEAAKPAEPTAPAPQAEVAKPAPPAAPAPTPAAQPEAVKAAEPAATPGTPTKP